LRALSRIKRLQKVPEGIRRLQAERKGGREGKFEEKVPLQWAGGGEVLLVERTGQCKNSTHKREKKGGLFQEQQKKGGRKGPC